jgi:DNA-binding CsgD family transcriptional regulator
MNYESYLKVNKLSPREKEVAFYLAEGLSTKDISMKIGIKSNTVSTFKKKIFLKLKVNTLVGLYSLLKG